MIYPFHTPGSRRKFLGRLAAAISFFSLGVFGGGRKFLLPSTGKNLDSNKGTNKGNTTMTKKIVKNIKKLGFPWQTSDPFLFCVHHEDFFPKGNGELGPEKSLLKGRNIGQDFQVKDGFRMYHGQTVPGFPEHPHRGFETVTVVQKGMVDHADSQGASGRYGGGDTQWMTAGSGIQHSEMFPLLNEEKENTMELFQIWLNLPAKKKMVPPFFKMLWNEKIPTYVSKDKLTKIVLVAGELEGHKPPAPPPDSWATEPESQLAIWIIEMEPGAEWTLPANAQGLNRTLYFFKGKSLTVADVSIDPYHATESIIDRNLLKIMR